MVKRYRKEGTKYEKQKIKNTTQSGYQCRASVMGEILQAV